MGLTRNTLTMASWLVAGGRDHQPGAPLNVPPIPASNFLHGGQRLYTRDDGSPTWQAFENLIGGMEGGQSVAFASGMAAVSAIFEQLPTGALVVLPEDVYQGVTSLARAGQQKHRWIIETLAVDNTAAWQQAASYADLIWLESPSNPLLICADLHRIVSAPRKPDAILAVDNTFATPLNQRPLELGATVSIQSATKFIGGHSDLLMGVASTRDQGLLQALRQTRELTGAIPGTLEAYLATRGARTLALRLERGQHNAMFLAKQLAAHPRVSTVRYPGLKSHESHAIARKQLAGFGCLISFDLDGKAEDADAFCQRLELIRHATSLGGVETTLERRAALPGQQHLPATLLRMSVGIEDAEDLWMDLSEALNKIGRKTRAAKPGKAV